jgi:putative transposase
LELVRYIHLNPIRVGIIDSIVELDRFPYCGHGALAGTMKYEWQNTDGVLRLFSDNLTDARKQYRQFVEKGLAMGRRYDLTGGGLIRSIGGWSQVVAMRHQNVFHKSDERILGDGEFVSQVLVKAQEQMDRRYRGVHTEIVIERVCEVLNVKKQDVFAPGKSGLG